MRSKLHPAIKIALVSTVLLISGWLLLRRFEIGVEFTSATSEGVPVITTNPSLDQKGELASPKQETQPNVAKPEALPKPDPALAAAQQGALRISNRSEHPIRVAFLSRQAKDTNTQSGTSQTTLTKPAHWDFAPNEGSDGGMVVSLPDQPILLKRGDVLVAFAQDGSQRYWGPYVVGETDRPTWNRQTAEWELAIEE